MKTMAPKNKRLAYFLILLFGLIGFIGIQKYEYPYGQRAGAISLPGVYGSLIVFAGEHNGWFPNSDRGAYDALQQLYDSYCPSGKELAGVSGDLHAVTEALRHGTPLNPTLTSWIYVPGFKLGDPDDVAILWESKPGLYYNGRRNDFGGHAVLLIDGRITNVPAADWSQFLKRQDELRKAVQYGRDVPTNTSRKPSAATPTPG